MALRSNGIGIAAVLILGAPAAWSEEGAPLPYEGAFGVPGVVAMDCANNPLTLTRIAGKDAVVMQWHQPVAQADGTLVVRKELVLGGFDGKWLYLTAVGEDVTLLRFSEDFRRFDLFSLWQADWAATGRASITFQRCALPAS